MNKGRLWKMPVKLDEGKALYSLKLDHFETELNQLLGNKIKFSFTGEIICPSCQKKTKKSYSGGFCFPCSQKLACCDICIVKPEMCHFAKGTCREPDWGEANCMIPHYVYLSNTSAVKVGITRQKQLLTRWIDQGATQGLPILKVQTRYISGRVEKVISELVSDKTNWREMLKGSSSNIDLMHHRDTLFESCGEELDQLEIEFGEENVVFLEDESITSISYPVLEYPKKVTSLSFDKTSEIGGELLGIKGQYLFFPQGVLNIRKFTSYVVEVDI